MSFPLPSLAALHLVCDAEKLGWMLMSPWEGEHPRWEQQSSAGKRVRGAVGGGVASWGWAPVGTFPATHFC